MSTHLLSIDDSSAIQLLVRSYLSDDQLAVHLAGDGISGLESAARLSPDLILLDLDLPDMNGFDVCRFLKASPSTRDIPVIFLSSMDSIDAKVCGLDLEAVDYITKPFHADELRARVQAALRGRASPHFAPSVDSLADVWGPNPVWH